MVPILSFPKNTPTGKTNKIFIMFDPMILPMANPASFLSMETIDTASSGSEVPMATMVMPMIRGDIRSTLEIFSARPTNI